MGERIAARCEKTGSFYHGDTEDTEKSFDKSLCSLRVAARCEKIRRFYHGDTEDTETF